MGIKILLMTLLLSVSVLGRSQEIRISGIPTIGPDPRGILIRTSDTLFGFCEVLALYHGQVGMSLFPAIAVKQEKEDNYSLDIYILVGDLSDKNSFIEKLDLCRYYKFVPRTEMYNFEK